MLMTKDEYQQELSKWKNIFVTNCTICNNSGLIYDKNGLYKMCECEKKAMVYAYLVACGVPKKYLSDDWTWNNFDYLDEELLKNIKYYAQNFEKFYLTGKGLYIHNPIDKNKMSFLETLISKEIMFQVNPETKKKYTLTFILFEELIQMSHQARNNASIKQKMDSIIFNSDILILDNIGFETGTIEYTTKFLDFILSKRINCNKPTIISSKFTVEQFSARYDQSFYSTINENFKILPLIVKEYI